MTIDVTSGGREFLLALADDKHLMGQQHAEWIGVTPFLEEDLAFCSIGQDELGHAALLYGLLAGDDDQAIDELAFGRDAAHYRSCHLVEMATNDWSIAFVRHWLFDAADRLRWQLIAQSSAPELSELAARVEREERYHRLHAEGLVDVLVADADAADRLRVAATTIAPLVAGLFEPVQGESEAISAGLSQGPFAAQWSTFCADVETRLGPIDWGTAPPQRARTQRSSHWQPLMDRMREVIDLDLSATW